MDRYISALILMLLLAPMMISASEETREEKDARMAWWREARFGMFIHWGVYSVPAGTWDGKQIPGIGEWIMNRGKIPVADYGALTKQFNPVKFDADEWVRMAKGAGMKYIVITSKHHDGFAMFHSKASNYNIFDATPFKRDPLKELAAACKKHGLKLGFYYSQAQDWHHPGGAASGGHWDKAQDGDMNEYIRTIAVPQVREVLSNYGPIAILWWDTPVDMNEERADMLLPLVKLQPGIITNNRLGVYPGDTETPEQFIPPTGYADRDWETCMTMNDTWGYKSYDDNWKSTEALVRNLIDIASKGGNYLLNVGPTSEGVIPQPSVDRLREIGKWMKANGDAIYGTSASPFKKLTWGRCTRKDSKLYLHVFNWPEDGILSVPMTGKVKKAYLLSDRSKPLMTAAKEDRLEISVPKTAPDPIASVVVLEVEGDVNPVNTIIRQGEDGSIVLKACDADIIGRKAVLEGSPEANVGYWVNAKDQVQWEAEITKPGEFEVKVNYACDPSTPGSEYSLVIGDKSINGKVESTGGWGNYVTADLGKVRIETPGKINITVKPTKKPGSAVMNLRSVSLVPVP